MIYKKRWRKNPILIGMLSSLLIVGCADDGSDGSDGFSTLSRTVAEAPGDNCPTGGQAIQTGLDSNADGTLADGEVTATTYQCSTAGSAIGGEIWPTGDYRNVYQTAENQLKAAYGLKVEYLTRIAGNHTDMMALWPHNSTSATHLITCVEGGASADIDGAGKHNPSVQAIDLSDGSVTTLLRGMDRCDGIRSTAWGTVVPTEESGTDGGAYEILLPTDPTTFAEATITDRGAAGATATIVDSADMTTDATSRVIKRTAMPSISWEGLLITDQGVVIGGDELRPGDWDLAGDGGDDPDVDGGAIFKFVPTTAYAGGAAITDLANSPLVAGSAYAFRASCQSGTSSSFNVNYGQGCEIGNGSWVSVDVATARLDANNNGATGYYRPEDLHMDPTFTGTGVRFCWANTGNEGAQNYGEVICGIDSDPMTADEATQTVAVNRFIEGDTDFTSVDNLAFQPNTGILYAIEDHGNGDIWACLPDGADRDLKSDGCVKVFSVKDSTAEPTGFMFSADGSTAYVSIQHSSDGNMDLYDDYSTDDLIKITGFRPNGAIQAMHQKADLETDLREDLALAYFGFEGPIVESATSTTREDDITGSKLPQDGVTSNGDDATMQLKHASALTAQYLTRIAGNHTDMMALWPHNSTSATHLITCVEGGASADIDGAGKHNPSVQAIDLSDGSVTTLLRGMDRCDGIRSTAWGTVVPTEESGTDGGAYEILLPTDPTTFAEATIIDRGAAGAAATIVDSADMTTDATSRVIKRTAMPSISWEGLLITDQGVVIGGDELRPGDWDLAGDGGDDPDVDGGAIFKFVPTTAYAGGAAITDLANSPLVAGSAYAFRASCQSGTSSSFNVNYGQGCEIGNGSWVSVDVATARLDANNNGATGYYRPEDLHMDPTFTGTGVRFCWANTGNEGAQNYGEVICGIDSDPMTADEATQTVAVNRFIEGDTDFTSVDNLAFQPNTGILYAIEDHGNGDIWACLPDGDDRDIKSDGCVKVFSVKEDDAEPTGFMFSADGSTAYLSIQHSGTCGDNYQAGGTAGTDGIDDCEYDDYDTDDVIMITGFNDVTNSVSWGKVIDEQNMLNAPALYGFDLPIQASATEDTQ